MILLKIVHSRLIQLKLRLKNQQGFPRKIRRCSCFSSLFNCVHEKIVDLLIINLFI